MNRVPKCLFSTSSVPAQKRYEAFRESMGVIFEVSHPERKGSEFSAHIESSLLGEILFVDCLTSGQRFRRSRQIIAQDGMDHYLVQFFERGQTRRIHAPQEAVGDRGNILIIDASQPWEAVNSDFHNFTLAIPRRLLAGRLCREDEHHGRLINGKNPFYDLLLSHFSALRRSLDNMSAQEAAESSHITLSLLSLAMNKATAGISFSFQDHGINPSLIKKGVKQYLEKNLHDSSLTIHAVAKKLRISRAHLYRLFEGDGGIANYLRTRRMDMALRKITAPEQKAESVSEIAFSVGYKDSSAFSRAFRQRFHFSPREAREVLNRQRSSVFEGDKQRTWEQWLLAL